MGLDGAIGVENLSHISSSQAQTNLSDMVLEETARNLKKSITGLGDTESATELKPRESYNYKSS